MIQIFLAFQEQMSVVIWLDHWLLSSNMEEILLANIIKIDIDTYC